MYFIAIAAPAEINEQVLQWKYYMRDHFACTVALRSPAHITLIPPFWMDEELESELAQGVGKFAKRSYPFDIRLKNFDAFKPRVIFVHVEENKMLEELKDSLENFLVSKNKYPIKKESRPFHAHLTIANRDLRKKDFAPAFEHFSKIEFEHSFPALAITLFRHNGSEWKAHTACPLGNLNEDASE
ncbi:MAG: RNA 2',3'-cyclic phosphodiesterase [Chitinophagaceae bacterium]